MVCELERYQLDIVGLTSTHSVGSGTKLWSCPWREALGACGDTHKPPTECLHEAKTLPGKVYFRLLERRSWTIVELQIQEEQCGVRPGHGTVDQIFTLAELLRGSWEFDHPVYRCFVDLESPPKDV